MDSYHSDPAYGEAMAHYLSGDWAKATEAFGALDRSYPSEAFIKLLLGNIAYSRGELTAAVDYYRSAIEARSDFGIAHYKLGVCLYRMGRLNEALTAFQAVVSLKSQSHAMARYFVGLINLFLGDDTAAAEAFEGFHGASPESKIANFYLAQLKLRNKDYRAALGLLTEIVDETPGFAEVHAMLGSAYYGLHDNAQAIHSFQRAVEIDPGDERSKSKLASLLEVQWP